MYIDTHAHFNICIDDAKFSEVELLEDMKKANVNYAVQVSTEQADFEWCREFAGRNNNIYFTLGIHPSSEFTASDLEMLEDVVKSVNSSDEKDKLFGIGEAGLDYYWMTHERSMQIELFERQIDLAKKNDLPLVIHTRDAMNDTIEVIKHSSHNKGIIHCFSGSKKEAKALLDLGYMISFTGNVTFKKSEDLQEVARYVPQDRILFETDCPYLSPVPMRGKKNKPDNVQYIYQFVAELRKEPLSELTEVVMNNFISLLRSKKLAK